MQSERATQLGLGRNPLVAKENIPCTKDGSDNATSKSKIPVLLKTRPVPDFDRIHQSFQNKFQKGKAVRKRACTRPCPFNLTQKGERFKLQPVTDVGPHPFLEPERPAKNSCLRGPLLEKQLDEKDGATVEGFLADPVALAGILSNSGLSSSSMGTSRATGLVQRVPVRSNKIDRASAYGSCGSSVARMETVRPSFMSRQTDKERPLQSQEPKPVLPSRPLLSLLMEVSSSAQSLTNPQSQSTGAMLGNEKVYKAEQGGTGERRVNMTGGGASKTASDAHAEGHMASASNTWPVIPKGGSLLDPVASAPGTSSTICDSVTCLGTVAPSSCSVGPESLPRPAVTVLAPDRAPSRAGEDSKDFVPDVAALASILSNTGLSSTMATNKKSSLAQRVPVRAKGMTSLYSAASSISMAKKDSLFGQRNSFDPKMSSGCMSRLDFKEKEMRGTPILVPQPSTKSLPVSSAQRVMVQRPLYLRLPGSTRRSPIFPKTFHYQSTGAKQTPSKKCRQWTDAQSPQSLNSCTGAEDEDSGGLPMEKIAVQLFPDDVRDAARALEQAAMRPSVDVSQEMNKLKHIELLARQLRQAMQGIIQPEFGANRDLDICLPADKIQSNGDLPALSQTLCKQENAVVGSRQCPPSCQQDQPTKKCGHEACLCTIPRHANFPNGGLTAGLWDTGGSIRNQSVIPPCFSMPAVVSDTFNSVDKAPAYSSQNRLCSKSSFQPLGPSLDPSPVAQSMTTVPLDKVMPAPRLPCVPTVPHTKKQRLYRLITSSQRFMDSCLDDECAFYTSRVASQLQDSSSDARLSCLNPVAQTLEWQEALCFIPIAHGEV